MTCEPCICHLDELGICQHARAKLEKRKSKLDNIPGLTSEDYFKQDTSDKKKFIESKVKGVIIKTTSKVIKSEIVVKSECVAWLKEHGFISKTIYTGGIPIGNGRLATNPSKGIPDTIIMNPYGKTKRFAFIEYKKSHGGILSQEQKNWHAELRACGIDVFVINSLEDLIKQFTVWIN